MLKKPETALDKAVEIIETLYKVVGYKHYDLIGSSSITLDAKSDGKVVIRLSTGFLRYLHVHEIFRSFPTSCKFIAYEAGKTLDGKPDWIFESEEPAVYLERNESVDAFRDRVWSALMKRYPNWNINSYIIIVKKHYYPNLSCEPIDTAVKQIEKTYKLIKKHKELFGAIAIGMNKSDEKEAYTLQFFAESLSEEDVNYIIRNGGAGLFRIEKKASSKWHFYTELRGDENLVTDTWRKLERLHPDWNIIDYLIFC